MIPWHKGYLMGCPLRVCHPLTEILMEVRYHPPGGKETDTSQEVRLSQEPDGLPLLWDALWRG